MHIRNWIVLVGAALVLTGCAAGRQGPPPGFGADDDDHGDGPPRPRAQLFISPSGQPFRAPGGQPYPVAVWFAQADANHDGRLTRDEFRADADRWFKALDVNGDGQISMPEVTRWEEELVPEITRSGLGMSGASGRPTAAKRNTVDTRLQGAAAYSLINEPHPIRGADSDFSFGVSQAEWRAASDRRFALLDVDGDGVLLLTDLKPTPAQAMAGMRPAGKRTDQRPEGRDGPRRPR
ncbi:MAG: EF-hand domain-containing protein [Alphaproteobacteria bacterium]|nr:EF-hand domain-containing protein [Alphaproteobacteria bacterium]MBU1515283.1 EF-hand domain-containing protein [Alphaproteobacteria bacterium]MBU2092413.1 EF-hand domain-containing protein [Alphaproteobacteria bacterium]MBU2153007.1 EF-hand domain-containing protein [Alphaproteobacteria bacterium]MBU2305838.1 EF-hand domain-containing protein [Alphaproteobacteria bacterium]